MRNDRNIIVTTFAFQYQSNTVYTEMQYNTENAAGFEEYESAIEV